MTLLEMTVVVLVILTLVMLLAIGSTAWKNGSDRSACIMNIRNVQQAVRSWQNMNAKNVGDTYVTTTAIIGAGLFVETTPVCPGAGSYTIGTAVPDVGTLVMTCSLATTEGHVPSSIAGW